MRVPKIVFQLNLFSVKRKQNKNTSIQDIIEV